MNPAALSPAAGSNAAEVCKRLQLSDEALKLLHGPLRLSEFQALLISKEMFADAVRVTAACLAPRFALWWGTLCLWSLNSPEPEPAQWAVFQAVIAWLKEPSDEHRRAAEAAGRAAGLNTPAGNLGLAVFLSEGSLSLPNLPAVAPGPYLTPKTVGAALVQASQKLGPGKSKACQARFLGVAHEVARGELSWESSTASGS
ncbi:MAG: hypothetical protein AB7K24_07910 [Gemmataceae bacterium]